MHGNRKSKTKKSARVYCIIESSHANIKIILIETKSTFSNKPLISSRKKKRKRNKQIMKNERSNRKVAHDRQTNTTTQPTWLWFPCLTLMVMMTGNLYSLYSKITKDTRKPKFKRYSNQSIVVVVFRTLSRTHR